MIQIQKILNDKDEVNTLVTHANSEVIIFTSRGNFHAYHVDQSDSPLKHKTSYYMKSEVSSKQEQDSTKKIIEFESD